VYATPIRGDERTLFARGLTELIAERTDMIFQAVCTNPPRFDPNVRMPRCRLMEKRPRSPIFWKVTLITVRRRVGVHSVAEREDSE
jgi:hypothetical protein